MRKTSRVLLGMLFVLAVAGSARAQSDAHWPQWRGPFFNGMARGDAPAVWSDTKNVKWKTQIPGRGFSTPVIWGERIFLTTAIPNATPAPTPSAPPAGEQAQGGQRRGA